MHVNTQIIQIKSYSDIKIKTLVIISLVGLIAATLSVERSEQDHINLHEILVASIQEENNICAYGFFAGAYIKSNGKREYNGLYVVKNKEVTTLLDNGKDMTESADDSKLIFLGASDGLYVYNSEKNVAEKYGSINDDIISIAKEYSGDVIYILTAKKEVFKVTDKGNVKEKIDNIVNAEIIILDTSNNIYYYTTDKKLYIYTRESSLKKVNGLPKNIPNITLRRSVSAIPSLLCVIDHNTYMIYPNGTITEYGTYTPKYKSTAFSAEASTLYYNAYDKEIYKINYIENWENCLINI